MARIPRKVADPDQRHRYPGEVMNIAGQRYGRLTAISFVRRADDYGRSVWLFRCDCGARVERRACDVRSGSTSSCGCLRSYAKANPPRLDEPSPEEHW